MRVGYLDATTKNKGRKRRLWELDDSPVSSRHARARLGSKKTISDTNLSWEAFLVLNDANGGV